ncbi:hypothetical protein MMC30_009380 [Trapelia coarctata]|nr:hypothetical protein [Trapelia coarctata]
MTSSGEPDLPDGLTNNDRSRQVSEDRLGSGSRRGNSSRRSTSPSEPLKRARTTPLPSTSASAATSPGPSREPSPTRASQKPALPVTTRLSRSRKNSHDLSPHRAPNAPSTTTVPSAAAIQRALSVAGTPRLPSPTTPEFVIDAAQPQKISKPPQSSSGLVRGAIPPRLKSPPPTASSGLYSPRRPDYAPLTPTIVLDRATPTSASSVEPHLDDPDIMVRSGIRSPVKAVGASTLETVQESSLPTTPATGMGPPQGNRKPERERPSTIEENPMESALPKSSKTPVESGSESGGTRSARARSEARDIKNPPSTHTASRPPSVNPKKSLSQLNLTKAKIASEGSSKNMTVETETVSSIPQVAVGGGTGERNAPGRSDTAGSLRLKPSSETIRPKREKKKTVRKAPSINSGTGGSSRHFHHHHVHSRAASPEATSPEFATSPDFRSIATNFLTSPGLQQPARSGSLAQAHVSQKRNSSVGLTSFRGRIASSKADIFEAKVASAVDEANSSDSDETFVYESNPPEPLSARPNRYHSRTPSATSMASQIDHHGGRYRQDGHHSITGKKSMKFANNNNNNNSNLSLHGNSMENIGSNGRTSGGNVSHHHIGRHGRGAAAHTSLFDNESPFPHAAKPLRTSASNGSHLSPRITTPRTPHLLRSAGLSSGKLSAPLLYDLEGEGADDERTPLVGTLRSGRTRNSRRPANRLDSYDDARSNGMCRKLTGWIVLGGVLGFLIAAVVIAVLLCSKPLVEVRIRDIQNVLASEQELTLDLHVHAINPNLVAIQITELDIGIYAKSKSVPFIMAPRETITDHKGSDGRDNEEEQELGYSLADSHYNWTRGGVDEGTDPIEDPDEDTQYQLLGRVLEFDAPLIFDASPLRHNSISSTGEIRLAKPGNQTKGLSEWWEKVIQHPFELKVRGPLRYSLPISSRVRSAIVSYTTTVQPEAPTDGDDDPKLPDEYSGIVTPDSASGRDSEVAGKRTIRFTA